MNSNTDEKPANEDWVVDISDNDRPSTTTTTTEMKELHESSSSAVSVCQVVRSLKATKAEDFTPQFVGLGPYHHFRPDLIMSRELKLGSAKRALHFTDEQVFLEQCEQKLASESNVLDFYHSDVSCKRDYQDLLQALALDGLFLLGILRRGTNPKGCSFFLTGKHGMPLVNGAGVELTMDAIVRDIFMLENQIPTHFLELIEKIDGNEIQSDLGSTMRSLCEEFCPLVRSARLSKNPYEYDHILHLMYTLTVGEPRTIEVQSEPEPEPEAQSEPESEPEPEPMPDFMTDEEACIFVLIVIGLVIILSPETKSQPETQDTDQQAEPETEPLLQPEERDEQEQVESESEPESKPQPQSQQMDQQDDKEDHEREQELHANSDLEREEPQPEREENDEQGNMDNEETQNVRENWFKARWKRFCRTMQFILGLLLVLLVLVVYAFGFIGKLIPWTFRYLCRKGKQVLHYIGDKLRDLSLIIDPMLNLLSGYDAEISALKHYTSNVKRVKRIREELMRQTTWDERPHPSATELHKAGIHLKPAESGISSIEFDARGRFFLPRMKLDVNSEVIIRNLVAYETLTKPKSLIFTRYVELMANLIQTPEDVHFLVRRKIIRTSLSKHLVAQLFNGLSKSIGPTNTRELDRVIDEVIAKFESTQKFKRIMIKCSSGKWFAIVAGLALLILTAVQTVCSVVDCSGSKKFA